MATNFAREYIVHCPLEWEYIDLVDKVGWHDGEGHNGFWENYEENFAVRIEGGVIESYASKSYYQREYPTIPLYTYEEFINKYFSSEKTKGKTMGVIKNVFKSETRRALEHFDVVNGDGGLTSIGRDEFVDYLWAADEEKKKEFTAKIVEEYKKRDK